MKRAERSNIIDNYVNGTIGKDRSVEMYEDMFDVEPAKLLALAERINWISKLNGVALSSDAFFPFRDNNDCAKQKGLTKIYLSLKTIEGLL